MIPLLLLQPGVVLQGRYQIAQSIGYGGMGAVYEVQDLRLNTRVALKQILRTEAQLRAAFEREAQLLANLHHDHLPAVTDYFSEGDSSFMVMAFVPGEDLGHMLEQQGAIPVAQVLQWADQLLDVLVYLHRHQPPIIHRDIKPQNIKINDRNQIVLLDFGIAKGRVAQGGTASSTSDQSVAAWTRHYAAPEQILQQGTDARSDLFSVAATLYHLLCNRRPIAAHERLAAEQQSQPDPLPLVHEVNTQVPIALGNLLHRALSLRPEGRPPSADMFRSALHASMATVSSSGQIQPEATELATDTGKDPPPRPVGPTQTAPSNGDRDVKSGANSAPRVRRPAQDRSYEGGQASSGQPTLQKRIHALVSQVLDSYPGAWLTWCDPRGEWQPLLERVAHDARLGRFPLIIASDKTAGEVGGLTLRRTLQAHIDAEEGYVLLVPTSADQLGWLWAHALRAERIYTLPLREQLLAWGWRPQSLSITEDELAVLARQGLQQDPAAWGGGGLQANLPLLLDVLAGGAEPDPEQTLILDLTVEQTGLPRIDVQDIGRWRMRALARLLVTHAHQVAPQLISASNEMLISEGQRSTALDLLGRWVDSLRLSKGLPTAITEADRIAVLGDQLSQVTVTHGPFLSRAAEQMVFTATCTHLAQQEGKALLEALAALQDDLDQHVHGFWGDGGGRSDTIRNGLAIPWSELLRLSRTAQTLLDVTPTASWKMPEEAIQWYTQGGWRLDVVGEELMRNLSRTTPELLKLITPLRNAYRSSWEQTLIAWTDVWQAAHCSIPSFSTAGTWLAEQLATPRPTAILVIDALRYDLGMLFAEAINHHEGAERATVQPARAPLPSISALGMGMALPIDESELRADLVGGEWRLIEVATGINLSVAEARRTWLREHASVPSDGILSLPAVLGGEIPEPAKGRTRLLITDATIDKLGHDDELEQQGRSVVLDRYYTAVTQLRDHGWRRILVVTDHGYIQWSGGHDRSVSPPVAGPAYRSRRALAYPLATALPGPSVLAPGSQWQIVPAHGASSWSAYGGLGYFHGGASLQEWIIPCLQVTWPSKARPVEPTLQPLEHVLSARPRVIVSVGRDTIFAEDALARRVDVVIRHATTRAIVFRSRAIELTPSQEQVAITLQVTPGVTVAWDAPLRIEVRDHLTEEVLHATDSVLRVRLDDW